MQDAGRQRSRIEEWLAQNGFEPGTHYDEITHVKPPALAYIDDRALHFVDWSQALAELGERTNLG